MTKDSVLTTRRGFLAASSGLLTLLPFAADAAEPWMDKKPAEWNPQDVQTILNRSGWVREAALEMDPKVVDGRSAAPRRNANVGLPTEFKVLVRWESGLPVRLARHTPLASNERAYLLSINRVPVTFLADSKGRINKRKEDDSEAKASIADQVIEATSLQRDKKDPIPATRAEWVENDFSSSIIITFPVGDQPIQLEDEEVLLVGRIGALMLRARFVLKQMIYRNRLEL